MGSIFLWWLAILLLGAGLMPLTNLMFKKFEDGGWMFSKVLGLFLAAYVMWVFNCTHILRFRKVNIWVVFIVITAVCYGLKYFREGRKVSFDLRIRTILLEEGIFLLLYLAAVYIVGFKPEAYGTEKFMDYGFLTAMMRADYMPFEDPWYAGYTVNYYYGGQYIMAFVMKMTGATAGMAYNLSRALITAASFSLPFSLVCQLMRDQSGKNSRAPYAAASLSGLAVAFCGNFHYVLFGIFGKLLKGADYSYWFPDATRYIGYDPDVADKTIHEFPSYSSVLGDLHAHYINILFVVLTVAIAYAWAQKESAEKKDRYPVLRPEILLIGFITGVFRWTNFWDFPIYFVTCGSIIFFTNLRTYRGEFMRFLTIMIGEAVEMFAVGYIGALPFTLTFDQISTKIGATHSHSPLYQLAVLWGLPFAISILFIVTLLLEYRAGKLHPVKVEVHKRRKGAEPAEKPFLSLPDMTVLLFSLCAMGLVGMPEFIYVKDIYGEDHYRANTMFKLTYQAFILFGIVMGYVLVRILMKKALQLRALSAVLTILLLLTAGYTGKAVSSWFGDILDSSKRISTDASVFISESFSSDFQAISWLNENVHDTSTILEAPGDSYSDYERVSVSTGLPTVLGWYVHEWLWRGNTDKLNERAADIQTIYTSTDPAVIKPLLEKYHITYIYVGSLEREKYPDLQDQTLQSLGETVYSDGSSTYILKVQQEN